MSDYLTTEAPDLKKLEPVLINDPQKFAEVVREVLAFGIYLQDREGVIRSWNQGAQSMTGLAPEAVIGQHFFCLFTDAARAENLPIRARRPQPAVHPKTFADVRPQAVFIPAHVQPWGLPLLRPLGQFALRR